MTPCTPGAKIVFVILRFTRLKARSWLASICEIQSVRVVGSMLV